MDIRILSEEELTHASGLSRYVFDARLRNRMEFTQTIPFVENYISEANLKNMCHENKLIVWGAFEQEQLVGVAGMQTDGMITLLYVLPQYAHKNCGSTLLSTMREYAKNVLQLQRVTVNATPAWTAQYFQRQGFSMINPNPGMHVPFVPMHAFSNKTALQKKERISGKTIAWAIIACVGFATVVASLFMIFYLFQNEKSRRADEGYISCDGFVLYYYLLISRNFWRISASIACNCVSAALRFSRPSS